MSGSKGYSYELERARQRELELQRARARWRAQVASIAELARACAKSETAFDVYADLAEQGYDRQRLELPMEADLDRVEALARAITDCRGRWRAAETTLLAGKVAASMASLRAELGPAHSDQAKAFLSSHVSESSQRDADRTAAAKRDREEQEAAQAERTTQRLRHRLGELLTLAGSIRDDAARGRVIDQARTLVAAGDSIAENDLRALEDQAVSLVKAQREADQLASLREEYAALLAPLPDEPLRQQLVDGVAAAATLTAMATLRSRIEAALADWAVEQERRFVVQQALEVWAELGYQVDSDFVATTLAGQPALLTRAGWPGHALQVRFSGDQHAWATNVVAFAETTAVREKEIEDEHCAHADGFQERLAERGVATRRTRGVSAGALPMQHLARPGDATRARTASSSTKAKGVGE